MEAGLAAGAEITAAFAGIATAGEAGRGAMSPWTSSDDGEFVTVAEYLEIELYHAIAEHLGVRAGQLKAFRFRYPERFDEATKYVLQHTVTAQCRTHVLDRLQTEC